MLRYDTTSVLAILISSTSIGAARSGKKHKLDAFSYAVWDAFPYSVGDEFPALLVSTDKSDQSDQPTLSEEQSSLRPTYSIMSNNNNLLTFYVLSMTDLFSYLLPYPASVHRSDSDPQLNFLVRLLVLLIVTALFGQFKKVIPHY